MAHSTQETSRTARSIREFDPVKAAQFRAQGQWRDVTFLDDFLGHVRSNPHKAAVVSYRRGDVLGSTITYGQLGAVVDRFAAAYLSIGIQPEDVVSIQTANEWRGVALSLAAMRVGAVPNPIPIIYREMELRHILHDSGSRAYFAPQSFRGYDFADSVAKFRNELPELRYAFFLDAPETADAPEAVVRDDFAGVFMTIKRELEPGLVDSLDRLRPAADDIAMLVYTSGTTGVPKGALHTYNTAWSGYRNVIVDALGLTSDDVCFMASTLGHLTGFIHGMLVPLSSGQKVVYQDLWDVDGLLEILAVEGLTWTLSSTTFALDMLDAQQQRPGPAGRSLRAFACGGATIPPGVAVAMDKVFGTSLVPLWGCSETGIASIHHLGAAVEVLDASDGYPVPWQETRIVDHQGYPVEPGTIGDLEVRGPGIFAGYLDQPEQTRDAFTPDGWYRTGDLGRVTPDGAIRIEGRSKDIIIRGGQNISAVEIENVLYRHPAIRDVAVVSYPDDRLGERVCAVVVPNGQPPTLEDIVTFVDAAGMAKPFWPQKLVVVSSLPRTPSGKVQKFVLRQDLLAPVAEHG